MMTLMTAALLAAQSALAPNPHAQHAQMQHAPMTQAQHEQHEGMKDCCKECCKDKAKHDEHAPDPKPQRGQ